MTSKEYLEKLRDNLTALSAEEREEAVSYYEEFFADAGEENASSLMAELGSPEKLAENILSGQNTEEAAWTEKSAEIPPAVLPEQKEKSSGQKSAPKKENNNLVIALVVIVLVVTVPVWGGALLGLVCGVAGILIALAVAVVAMVLGGIALLVWSVVSLVMEGDLTMIAMAGTGLILLALGLGLSVPTYWLYAKGIPALFRGCKKLFYRLTGKSAEES